MAIPNENYVLRLHEKEGSLYHMRVLDLLVTGPAERTALVEWGYGRPMDQAGFSVIRFDPLGKVLSQFSKTLCLFSNVECGNYSLETGSLIQMKDGFIIAGTATNIYTGVPHAIAIRVDNVGNIRWGRKYVHDIGHPSTSKIMSIVPLATPDHFLISASTSDDDTILYTIEGGSGTLLESHMLYDTVVYRLRRTSFGVLAVGALLKGGLNPSPAIFAFTDTDVRPLWVRWAIWEKERGEHGIRWFDVAEGESKLLLIGNEGGHFGDDSPMMTLLDKSMLPKTTDVIKTFVPTLGDKPVRLRSAVNHQDLVIPLTTGGDTFSAFAVTGEVDQQPWLFVIKDDGTMLFQKKLRIPDGAQGGASPVIWASYEEIISGGFVKTGSTPRGFIASSPVTNLRGTSMCSAETPVVLVEDHLYAEIGLLGLDPLNMHMTDWSIDEGRDVDVKMGCLDLQG